jgi:hypothetical protein
VVVVQVHVPTCQNPSLHRVPHHFRAIVQHLRDREPLIGSIVQCPELLRLQEIVGWEAAIRTAITWSRDRHTYFGARRCAAVSESLSHCRSVAVTSDQVARAGALLHYAQRTNGPPIPG